MKILHDGKAVIVGTEGIPNIGAFPDLEVIGCNMTGTEHLPWDGIRRRGIKVFSLKGETEFLREITSTAEHTIGLIIALLRNYKTALNGPYRDREVYKGHTITDKTFGIIGLGRIGVQVAMGLNGLGVDKRHLVFYDKFQNRGRALRTLLRDSDVVTIHIPLWRNEGFFTREMFTKMKPTALLINTSRSGIVDKGALLWALENAIIAGAAVDFIDDPDLVAYAETHDNLILTNHVGGCTYEDMEKTEAFITEKVNDYMKTIT